METKISKWGNSYAIRIPSSVVKQMKLKENATLYISASDNMLTAQKEEPSKRLARLLSKVKNTQPEYDWGKSIGKELL